MISSKRIKGQEVLVELEVEEAAEEEELPEEGEEVQEVALLVGKLGAVEELEVPEEVDQ